MYYVIPSEPLKEHGEKNEKKPLDLLSKLTNLGIHSHQLL